MARATGFVVWEGLSPVDGAPIVLIATLKSANRKTGDMVQTWILRQDMAPGEAIATGADASVCGSCPHRGRMVDGRNTGRSCYVDPHKAPLSVWRTYQRGGYARVSPLVAGRLLAGRSIRLGAYGDPAMVPLSVLRALVARASGHTGYTHQWRNVNYRYRDLLMASADSIDDYKQARRKGYRAFVVVPRDADSYPAGTVECMAVRDRNPKQCIDCGACAGTRNGAVSGAVSIAIRAHGIGAKYVTV